MSNNYLHPDYQSRINPQFVQTTKKYLQIKKQRVKVGIEKKSLENTVIAHKRSKQSLDQSLRSKSKQLKWLQCIRKRHIADHRYKVEKQEINNLQLESLRKHSMSVRQTTKKNIRKAIKTIQNQKSKASKQVKSQLMQIKDIKERMKQDMNILFTMRSRQMEVQKSHRKRKMNRFFQDKNKALMLDYKKLIRTEQVRRRQQQESIMILEKQRQRVLGKIDKKRMRLERIQDRILSLKKERV